MHELSLSSAILETAVRHADGRPVKTVELTVGVLRQVVPASLEFYWDIVTRDTVCEGARLELEVVPAVLRCDACESEWEIDVPAFVCGRCGPAAVRVISGEELEVESIEIETEEAVH